MWTAIAGAAMALGGSIYSGIKSAEAAKKARLYLDDYDRDSQNRANRDIYRDYNQTATAQAENTALRRLFLEDSQNMTGQAAVGHSTRAQKYTRQGELNDIYAKHASNVVVNGEQLAQHAKDVRAGEKQYVTGARVNMAQQSMKDNAAAGAQMASAGINLAMADAKNTLNGRDSNTTQSGTGNTTAVAGNTGGGETGSEEFTAVAPAKNNGVNVSAVNNKGYNFATRTLGIAGVADTIGHRVGMLYNPQYAMRQLGLPQRGNNM